MKGKVDYSLYLCTDRELMTSASVEESVELAIKGGVTLVQLREKNCGGGEFYAEAIKVKAVSEKYGVPLIINDRVDVALAAGADGVHVGQSDLPCSAVRKIVGDDMIVGVSASDLEQAIRAEADGADYIGVGAMFSIGTKTDAEIVSFSELDAIRAAVSIPIVVIGGINKETLPLFKGRGINGAAVVSAIVAQNDVEAAARDLSELWKSLKT